MKQSVPTKTREDLTHGQPGADWATREAQPLKVSAAEGETIELKRTYCKICMTNCGIVAEVAAIRKILSVKGDFDHPITKGYTCPKGRATGQVYHLDQPITSR